ncbi:hypothetical protein QOZ80_1AG0010280 [Eleusine coracana subsp. coracana]|nr:hypothetical protein QOZ80_1AG0010280 [Eleusine coracana subsp. coracana]
MLPPTELLGDGAPLAALQLVALRVDLALEKNRRGTTGGTGLRMTADAILGGSQTSRFSASRSSREQVLQESGFPKNQFGPQLSQTALSAVSFGDTSRPWLPVIQAHRDPNHQGQHLQLPLYHPPQERWRPSRPRPRRQPSLVDLPAGAPCKSRVCTVANTQQVSCSPVNDGGQPGSTDPHCTCTSYPYNPVCGNVDLTVVKLSANATDGSRPLFPVSFKAYEACAPDGLLESLPSGVAGLSRLPLGGQTGAAIFGGGPFQLTRSWPSPPPDLAEELRQNTLPFLKNPKNGARNYFHLHGIAVSQEQVPIETRALDLDSSSGKGVVPRRQARWPFLKCYEASAFIFNHLGPVVADIDLMLDDGRNWTLPGANSLVQADESSTSHFFTMDSDVGFPNSKAIPASPAVILGAYAYHLENNLVHFDLEKSTFGFRGLLHGRLTQCGNFNFNSS